MDQEHKYMQWCIEHMQQAKTRKDVYKIWTIWTNHVDRFYDDILKQYIPKELK